MANEVDERTRAQVASKLNKYHCAISELGICLTVHDHAVMLSLMIDKGGAHMGTVTINLVRQCIMMTTGRGMLS